jgi:hypothetical protein
MRAANCFPSAMPGAGRPEEESSIVRSEGRRTGLSSQSRGRALQTGFLLKLYQLTSVHSRDNLPEDTNVQAGTLRAEERRGLARHLEVGNPAPAGRAKVGEAAEHEARADEQHQRERDADR